EKQLTARRLRKDRSSVRNRWIYRHCSTFDLLCKVARSLARGGENARTFRTFGACCGSSAEALRNAESPDSWASARLPAPPSLLRRLFRPDHVICHPARQGAAEGQPEERAEGSADEGAAPRGKSAVRRAAHTEERQPRHREREVQCPEQRPFPLFSHFFLDCSPRRF